MLLDVLRVEVAHLGVDVGVRVLPLDRDRHGRRAPTARWRAFAAMRKAMPGPLGATHPVGDAAQAIVDGVHARSRTVYAPGVAALLSPTRMALRTRLGERDARAVAPELDRLTAERVAQLGAFGAALRDTPGVGGGGRSVGMTWGRREWWRFRRLISPLRGLSCQGAAAPDTGFPATTTPAGTSRVTTLPAPTMLSSPTVTPGSTIAPAPIQVFASSVTGAANSMPARRPAASRDGRRR